MISQECFRKEFNFPKKILGSRISLTYRRLRKILRKFYKISKIGPRVQMSSLGYWSHGVLQYIMAVLAVHMDGKK